MLMGGFTLIHAMGGVSKGNAISMDVTVYPMCSFQMPNAFLLYTLSDPLRIIRMAPMGTPLILEKHVFAYTLFQILLVISKK